VVDVVWTVIGYTPGTFPRAEVFELPTVHNGSAEQTNLAIQDVFEQYLAEDFKEVHPLLVHVHSGNAIHTTEKQIASIADLKGLKLRTPSRTGAWMIETWGAEPVGMPVPELPQALSKKIIDGALIPFEVVLPLKVHELTQHSVEGPKGERFGSAVFLFAMNKQRYEALPDDLKQVIDDNSGPNMAGWVGENWDGVEVAVKDIVTKAGHSIETLDAAALAEFQKLGEPVVQRWVEDVTAQGIDGKALVEAARQAVASHAN
jgi:TRAP-type C4-dicarboxylate transport system substrate-binding protein